MQSLPFDFGTALSHFTRTGGPKGFLWKFGLAYMIFGILVQALTLPFLWPMMAVSLNPETANDPDAMMETMTASLGPVLIGYTISIILGILIWVMFDAASQRRYMRGEGFKLRLGADEGRLFVVGLLWFVLLIALYIGFAVLILVPVMVIGMMAGNGDGSGLAAFGIIGFLLALAAMIAAIWICIRFSAASALTIRDKKIRFFESWRVTKGKVWTLFFAWIVLGLIFIVFVLIYFLVVVGGSMAPIAIAMSSPEAQTDPTSALSPAMFILPILGLIVYLMAASVFMHIFAGPAALAAKTDPSWIQPSVSDAFA